MAQIINFPKIGELTVEELLEKVKGYGLTSVLILGFDESDDVTLEATRMENKDALWLCAVANKCLLDY